MSLLRPVFVVGAKRTPFGTFGGALKATTATQLGVVATQAALAQANVDPSLVDQVFFGNVIPSSTDAAYLARHVALQSGMKLTTPSLTLNRLCGSGFESVIQGALQIQVQAAHVVVCGGAENMSMAPLQAFGHVARWGVSLGQGLTLSDSLWDGLTDAHAKTPMGMTAENLADDYGITRQVRMIYECACVL
jgi:acetyl-CoA acyltransferase 2